MDPTLKTLPIKQGLFTEGPEPQLIGSACKDCGEIVFPQQKNCPACCGHNVEERPLSRRGHLWTWTIQSFLPPTPYTGERERFAAYGVGYVELAEGIRVEGRLTSSDPAELKIGMPMELVLQPFRIDEQGRQIMTFAFNPIKA